MTLEEIKELVQVVIDSGVAELEVTRGDNKVCIRKNSKLTTHEILAPGQMPPAYAGFAPAAPAMPVEPEPPSHQPAAKPAVDEGLEYVKSPIVGTFYEASSPDAQPFVRTGDRITPGQVLCIIESMKLMNEIEAEISGTIVGKLVENARPVEYGEALFSIKPD